MKRETFTIPTEAAQWAASSIPGARDHGWLALLLFPLVALPLWWEWAGWALLPVYMSVLALRVGALVPWADAPDPQPDRWPTLSVLLPVYREPAALPALARAVAALDYPDPEVALLVEQDDFATRAALAGWPFRTIIVPPGYPRTKPRAVNYGMAHTTGEVVVIFDAEDRPAPEQPKRAVARLLAHPRRAVVQAALTCDHSGPLLARMWALEYEVLFRGVLPLLARLGLPFLLGGTSQYLRREALELVGGFDAYNVTEDAELAVRLARDWNSSAILTPTGEEAPMHLGPWVRQRSRWLKGWMQTALTHWRTPLPRRVRAALAVQLGGQIVCVAAHPVGLYLLTTAPGHPLVWALAAVQVATAGIFAVAARRAGRSPLDAFALPAYCLLHWIALCLAAVELVVAPHYWRKTEHGVVQRD